MTDGGRQKLVAHLRDGEVLKGYSSDFDPQAEAFHLMSLEQPVPSSRRIEVDALKALFFVKTWGRPPGSTRRQYRFGVGGMLQEPGKRVVVRFHDGERIWGYALSEDEALGFYLIPADPEDNNIKLFVNRTSLEELQVLDPPALSH